MNPTLQSEYERAERMLIRATEAEAEVERLEAAVIEHREDAKKWWAEVERLRRWKAEVMPVMDGLQDLGRALGLRTGSRITGTQAAEVAASLVRERDALRRALHEEVGYADADVHPGYCDPASRTDLDCDCGLTDRRVRLRAALGES